MSKVIGEPDASKCCGPVQACLRGIEEAAIQTGEILHLIILMRDVAIQCKDDYGVELANSMLPAATEKAFGGKNAIIN